MEFRNVLVFTDGRPEGERALQVGAEVARKSGGSLHILFAVAPPVIVQGLGPELDSALHSGQIEELERLRRRARELGVDAQAEARIGKPFVEIIRACRARDCDLVVKAARGRERMGWPLLGSTALHLLRKAPVPVWLVGGHPEPVPRRVMALLSSDLGSDERQELDRRVLDVAHAASAAVGGELSVGAAWDAPGEGLLHRRMPAEQLQAYVEGSRRQAEEALGRALEPWSHAINPARVHLVRGVPYVELVALAAERADLVVIGTTPPRAGAAFLIREEAEEVINRLDTSIVAVKAAGFESPVGLS